MADSKVADTGAGIRVQTAEKLQLGCAGSRGVDVHAWRLQLPGSTAHAGKGTAIRQDAAGAHRMPWGRGCKMVVGAVDGWMTAAGQAANASARGKGARCTLAGVMQASRYKRWVCGIASGWAQRCSKPHPRARRPAVQRHGAGRADGAASMHDSTLGKAPCLPWCM